MPGRRRRTGIPDHAIRRSVRRSHAGGYFEGDASPDRDEGPLLPSSEWRLHAAVYESKPEVRAIVHTHSPKATAVSCLESGIPPFHYMVAMSGAAEIPCAPYATFGTEALAESVTGALRHCRVCLMAHHGVLATGSGLPGAFALAVETENLASMYLDLLQLGDVRLLPEDEMARVLERFRTYGQPGRKA